MGNRIEQAKQMLTPVWDGNLISKADRDALVKAGLAVRVDGYNMLTKRGVKTMIDLGYLTPNARLDRPVTAGKEDCRGD